MFSRHRRGSGAARGDIAAPVVDALRETAVEAAKVGTKTAAKWAMGCRAVRLRSWHCSVSLSCFPGITFAFPFFLMVFTLMGAVTVYLAAQRAVSAAAVEATQRLHLVRGSMGRHAGASSGLGHADLI